MMTRKASFTLQLNSFIILVIITLLSPLISLSQITTQWRGEERRGIYPATDLLASWPAEGPALIRVYEKIGNGYGSPTIAGDMLYITGESEDTAYLFAFDSKGKLLWKSSFGPEWVINYQGSRCAPTVVNDLVYVTSGLGNLACFEAKTGKKRWSKEYLTELHGASPLFGFAEAPLVHGNQVFATPGGPDTNVVALDRFTGDINWVCPGKGEVPGYNSPILIHLPERDIIALFTAYSFLGIDTRTGTLLWSHDQDNIPLAERQPGNGDTHSNSAWFEDGYIYYIAGDGNGAVKLELLDNGMKIRQVWRNKGVDNYMGGFVIQDDRIYTCTSNGKSLVALDVASGEIINKLKIGTGTLIWADGKIYYYTQGGKVCLVDPFNMEEISSFKINRGTQEHFAHPVIHNGILYVRHGNVLMAYDIAGK
ncbi:MAG: PQQ-like beta-propeller repeat protein [Bacteroidales bacterium]|nr:PQQ-like beta-propeller repeat protein [Bacteroidales bacterium]